MRMLKIVGLGVVIGAILPTLAWAQDYDGAWTNATQTPSFVAEGGVVTYFSSRLVYFCCCWWQITTSRSTSVPSPITDGKFEATLSTSDGSFLFKGYFVSDSVCTGTYSMTSASCFAGGNWAAIKAGSGLAQPEVASFRVVGATIAIGITNLTSSATNYVMYSESLVTGHWLTAAVFQATGGDTNWSEPLRAPNTFYKIESRK